MDFHRIRFNKGVWRRGPLLLGLLAAVTLAGLAGCNGPTVQYDYDARMNYSGYRTFDWTAEPAHAPVPGGGFDNPIMNERVRRAVETELAAKGFHRDVTADPDFLVTYYPAREPGRSQQVHLGVGFGMGPLGIGVGGPVGDPHREAMAGIVLEVQGSDDPAQADADVTEAVRSMLKRFPPGK